MKHLPSSSNGDLSQTWCWFLFAYEVLCAVAPPTKMTCCTEGDITGLFLCEIIVKPLCSSAALWPQNRHCQDERPGQWRPSGLRCPRVRFGFPVTCFSHCQVWVWCRCVCLQVSHHLLCSSRQEGRTRQIPGKTWVHTQDLRLDGPQLQF